MQQVDVTETFQIGKVGVLGTTHIVSSVHPCSKRPTPGYVPTLCGKLCPESRVQPFPVDTNKITCAICYDVACGLASLRELFYE